jgi:hypothetical protein
MLKSATAQAHDAELATRPDETIDRALAERRIVGTVVTVMRAGEVAYRRAALAWPSGFIGPRFVGPGDRHLAAVPVLTPTGVTKKRTSGG